MQRRAWLHTLACFLCAALTACGGSGSGDGGPALIATFDFDESGGTAQVFATLPIAFGAHTPDAQSTGVDMFVLGEVGNDDDGILLVAQPGQTYYESLAALTDGNVSDVGVGIWNSNSSAAPETHPRFQILDPTPGVVDLAGFSIEAIHCHIEDVWFYSSAGWTDYSYRGTILIYGRRAP